MKPEDRGEQVSGSKKKKEKKKNLQKLNSEDDIDARAQLNKM